MRTSTDPRPRRARAALVAAGLGIAGIGAGAATVGASDPPPDINALEAEAVAAPDEWTLDLEQSIIFGESPVVPHYGVGSPVVSHDGDRVTITIDGYLFMIHDDVPNLGHYGHVRVSDLTVWIENGAQQDAEITGQAHFNDANQTWYEHELTDVEAHLNRDLGTLVFDISSERGPEATFVFETATYLLGIDVEASDVGGDPADYAHGVVEVERRPDGAKVINGVVGELMSIGFHRLGDELYHVEIHDLRVVVGEDGYIIDGTVAGTYDHLNWRDQYSRHGELSRVSTHGIEGTSAIAVTVWSEEGPEALIVLDDRHYAAAMDVDLAGTNLGSRGKPTYSAGSIRVTRDVWNHVRITLADAVNLGTTAGDESYEVAVEELRLVVDHDGRILDADAFVKAYQRGPTGPSEGVVLKPVTTDVDVDRGEVRLGFIGLDGHEADILFRGVS